MTQTAGSRRGWPAVTGMGQMPQAPSQDPVCVGQPTGHLRGRPALQGSPADISIKNDRSSASKSLLLVPVWRDALYPQGPMGVWKHWGQRNTPLRLEESPSWIYRPQTPGRSTCPRQVCPGHSACFPKTRRIMHGLPGEQKTTCH